MCCIIIIIPSHLGVNNIICIAINIIIITIIIIILQCYDEMIKNYTKEAVVILKTEPDLVHLVEQLQ